ncbi:LysR family transcriptional regulator (plasmid) [Rhizobium sp. Pop5]|uniref:DNA-binding transcriptional LysR family regulator n=2 Tax=Rhizobium TaxID=379 RepID=A0A7W6VR15_9HYPH|nr:MULTISPECIES: LysR family transcriptional regulator [Rhizobium]KEC69618.1 LysR family transcriptional regulator [Rhizobium leguminosarum bv. phaseoli CCGM1]EJZ17185.1 LysR family nopaline catabolism transcriptional regulator [Rhizobium sp. Pop5]MBB4194516.1 DNA-binding transcriptional LysR family regulator [Rhizobium aethiopicum]MBB4582311.1 DNA-binding transcriptional LysR family regulator [Rhizobium aethiopicum]MDK4729001.1 LysR family transcriptional regulator [Rhizobium phaseoli]
MEITDSGVKIRHLQILREVMRAGSERLAAQMLRITQPAVSQNIKQLEETVGFALFRRENNRLIPTVKAWEFLRTIDAAFAGLDRIGPSIDFLRNNDTRMIGIAAPSAFSFATLPKVVKRIRERSRSYAVQVKSGTYEQIADHVLNGRSDLGISRLPLDERILDWVPVGSATNVCLFPANHRFAAQQLVTAEDLASEAIIDIDPQIASHQMSVNALRYMGTAPDIAVEYDANGHDIGYVMAGIGVSITNEIIASEYAEFDVAFREFQPGATYHYVVVWQKDRKLSDSLRFALEEIVAALTDRAA